MKTMTCKQLAGACDEKFHAETFEEMGEMSKKHAMEMVEKGDAAHSEAMNKMKEMMNTSAAQEWFEKAQKEFDNLPED